MTDYKIIQTINGPEDVKKLSMEQLEELASEIREALFNRLTKIGGHFGPNFGMVEAEIAMHYVFSSPKDKFIFDVSHTEVSELQKGNEPQVVIQQVPQAGEQNPQPEAGETQDGQTEKEGVNNAS